MAKPANNATATPAKSDSVTEAATGTDKENAPNTLADSKKNNLLPTIIVLSIVIGCVAIVSFSKKIT